MLSRLIFTRVFFGSSDLSGCLAKSGVALMPYTPPSQRSPAASKPESPVPNGSNSYFTPHTQDASTTRPRFSRSSSSASYLNRERRSPSFQLSLTPDATPVEEGLEGQKELSPDVSQVHSPHLTESSFPNSIIPSPPDSAQNSSDDEEPERGRARELQMQELKDAVNAIELHRQGSPEADQATDIKPKLALDLSTASMHARKFGLSSPPLSKEARKISHSRSNTDSAVLDLPRPVDESPESESDLEEEGLKKPPMLRKKSGELVRPALRPPSARRRPSSMPGTPTYNKAVHFDNNLEHVRHFLKVDRPLAVSAGSSPVELHEGETEFPFHQKDTPSIEPRWQWDIQLPNFPPEYVDRKHMPIRAEKVFVSADNKNLIGTVAVHNLAFHKSVVARFTLDYWKTTSEVSAEYSHDIRRKPEDDHDRFNFNIKLEDLNNLEKKTLFFCVRYNVDGQEFWDSNGGVNFQIDFSKKAVPQKGKSGTPSNASRPLNSSSGGRPRPVSVPTFDDFNVFDSHFGSISSPAASLTGESPLKLRNKAPDTIVPDAPGIRAKNQSQAFGTRYDFGASLSATKQGSSFVESPKTLNSPSLFSSGSQASFTRSAPTVSPPKNGGPSPKADPHSDKPSLHSQSYNDLINKYCFVRSYKGTTPGPEEQIGC